MAAPRKLLVGSRLFTEFGVPSTPQQRPQRKITKYEWTRLRRLVTPSGHDQACHASGDTTWARAAELSPHHGHRLPPFWNAATLPPSRTRLASRSPKSWIVLATHPVQPV